MKQYRAFYFLAAVVLVLAVNFSWGFFSGPKNNPSDTAAGATPMAEGTPGKKSASSLFQDMVDLANEAIASKDGGTLSGAIAGATTAAESAAPSGASTSSPDAVTGPTPDAQAPDYASAPGNQPPDTNTGPTPNPATAPAPPPDTTTGPTPNLAPAPSPGTTPAPPPDTVTEPTPPAPAPGTAPAPSPDPEEDDELKEREGDAAGPDSTPLREGAPSTEAFSKFRASATLKDISWLGGSSREDVSAGFREYLMVLLDLRGDEGPRGVAARFKPFTLQPLDVRWIQAQSSMDLSKGFRRALLTLLGLGK